MTLISALGASLTTAHRASTFRNIIANYEATEYYYPTCCNGKSHNVCLESAAARSIDRVNSHLHMRWLPASNRYKIDQSLSKRFEPRDAQSPHLPKLPPNLFRRNSTKFFKTALSRDFFK